MKSFQLIDQKEITGKQELRQLRTTSVLIFIGILGFVLLGLLFLLAGTNPLQYFGITQ